MVINNADPQLCNQLSGELGGRGGGSGLSSEVKGPQVREIPVLGLLGPQSWLWGLKEYRCVFLGVGAQPGLEGGLGQAR